jgi:hypothetical protein
MIYLVIEIGKKSFEKKCLPTVGLEPTILGLGGRCLIHWATWATVVANVKLLIKLIFIK